jgi:hypothetical protein
MNNNPTVVIDYKEYAVQMWMADHPNAFLVLLSVAILFFLGFLVLLVTTEKYKY